MAGKRLFISIGLMFLLLLSFMPRVAVDAQDDNLLTNGSFDGPGSYSPVNFQSDFTFAQGWSGWYTNSPSTESWMNQDPIAYPHTASFRYDGNASQNIGRGDATFTAAAYQVVDGIAEGTTLEASAWVLQDNDEGNGARTRIGIGSNVGGNPLASAIEWSSWTTAIDSWQRISVRATVPAGSVTVFIYSTQDSPNAGNQNYYDQAELVVLGQGQEVNVGSTATPAVPPTNTPPPYAAFVSPQEADEDGRIEHTVRSGDTLAAIAVAYGVPSSQIRELNNLDGGFLQVGQVLLIQEGDPDAGEETDQEGTGSESGSAEETREVSAEETAESSGFATPTSTPQEVAEEPTATATPDVTATPTEIPATPTTAPTAPVEEGDDSDPLTVETAICVLMFDDTNQNTVQEPGEELLAGGLIILSGNESEVSYTTDGEQEPFCFTPLDVGTYNVSAEAPAGYGLVNSNSLVVNMQAGQQFTLRFAAAEGVEVAQAPTPDNSVIDEQPEIVEEAPQTSDNSLRNIAGVIVMALAGVVLLGGIGVAVFVARR